LPTGVRRRGARARRTRLAVRPHQGLGGAHRQALGDDAAGGGLDRRRLLEAEQRAGVAHRQPAILDHRADRLRQLEQADRVGHRRAILADPVGDLVGGQRELLDQPLVGQGLLDRVQVGALEVLDQRALEGLARCRRPGSPPGRRGVPARCAARQRRSPAIRCSRRPAAAARPAA
jgi:hypothetical protein